MNELSGLLAGLPGVVERLLATHLPDEHGRCVACTRPGTGIPGQPWPCALRYYAQEARAQEEGR